MCQSFRYSTKIPPIWLSWNKVCFVSVCRYGTLYNSPLEISKQASCTETASVLLQDGPYQEPQSAGKRPRPSTAAYVGKRMNDPAAVSDVSARLTSRRRAWNGKAAAERFTHTPSGWIQNNVQHLLFVTAKLAFEEKRETNGEIYMKFSVFSLQAGGSLLLTFRFLSSNLFSFVSFNKTMNKYMKKLTCSHKWQLTVVLKQL